MIEQASRSRVSSGAAPQRNAGGYAGARAVEVRAQTTVYGQDAESRKAMERLSQRLSSGEPLRRDVPPGFYLNIRV